MPSRRSVLKSAGGLALAGAAGALTTGAVASSASGAGAAADWDALKGRLTGDLIRPSDATYQHAKTVYMGEFSVLNPQGVAYCESADDVRACLRFVQDNGISLRTRSGGHNLAGWSTGQGLVVDVSRINQATVDGATVHMGPGAMSIDAVQALKPHNKQLVTGTCSTVCPGGFISGGGIGHQTRKYGLGADRLVSAKVMLADGRLVHTSATREPDLFWALRGGGGGNFGIVLDFEVTPINQPRGVFFDTVWSWDKAKEVVEAWQKWSISGSRNLGSALLVALPDAAPGKTPTIMLTGAYWGPQSEIEEGLDALASQAGTQPVSKSVTELDYSDVQQRIYGCGQMTVRECHLVGQNPDAKQPRNGLLRERTRVYDRAIEGTVLSDALAAFDSDRYAGQTRFLSFTATGGKANEVGRCETAYWHRSAQFMNGFAAMTQNPTPPADEEAAIEAWVDKGSRIIEPVSTGGAYVNFPDPRLDTWPKAYYGSNYARLQQVKRRFDPDNLFQHNQSIGI